MSTTTTIRLPDELKERIARSAERAGTTAHNFMVAAIAEKTDLEERRAAFLAEARQRYNEIAATGRTVPWDEMRDYMHRRIADPSAAKE